MLKLELSKTQLRDLNIFNLLLESDGWEDHDGHEQQMDAGEEVHPEGKRTIFNGKSWLEACFHAPINMISLKISEYLSSEAVQFHFFFDSHPERLLEWLIQFRPKLSLDSYPSFLKNATLQCEMTLMEISGSGFYEVKPPTGSSKPSFP